MRFNHEEIPEVEQDPMQQLMQMTAGCIVIGYEKDTRKKMAFKFASDNAAADALTFFDPHVQHWMKMGDGTYGLEPDDE